MISSTPIDPTRIVNSIEKVWLTNEYEHHGLRKSSKVFEHMLALRREGGRGATRQRGVRPRA
jgi:hypothetical protein